MVGVFLLGMIHIVDTGLGLYVCTDGCTILGCDGMLL